jgi:ABC-type bacteriocin/lantibiotic exporter with double-glycine peptidase domain
MEKLIINAKSTKITKSNMTEKGLIHSLSGVMLLWSTIHSALNYQLTQHQFVFIHEKLLFGFIMKNYDGF